MPEPVSPKMAGVVPSAIRDRIRRIERGGAAFLLAALAAMLVVAGVVAPHSIAVVQARGLLPTWDLAAHLSHGWLDYHFLITGQPHRLLWDLWLQGYWPPMLSIIQIPFYIVTGGDITGGLWSTLATFVGVGVAGASILRRLCGTAAWLPAALFIGLLSSSPFLLAYGTVTMTETLGALAQLVLIDAYLADRQHPSPGTARRLAIAMGLLFFTKYNYFLLLVAPLVLYEWMERTPGLALRDRARALVRLLWRGLASPIGAFVAIATLVMLVIVGSGGFETRVWGHRLSVRGVGNAGHLVLYIVLARIWFLHARGRIDWSRLTSQDPRVRPILAWFVVPVTIWLAAPYPNHLRDFFNFVVNRPMGADSLGSGLSVYADALRGSYFASDWVLAAVLATFLVAAVSYRRQPPCVQWLLLTVPFQCLAIVVHQTRFARFLLPTVVLLMLIAAGEVGRWCAASSRRRVAAVWLSPVVIVTALMACRGVVASDAFRAPAFELYTDSAPLRSALGTIRAGLTGDDRLAVVGQSNVLSPALLSWELGPPAGAPRFPIPLAGVHRQDMDTATQVLLLESIDSSPELDDVTHYLVQRDAVLLRVARGDLQLRQQFVLPELGVTLRLFHRERH